MAWEMRWYDDAHTIILFTVTPQSSWKDFNSAMEMYADELGKTDKILYTIIYNEYGFLSANPVPYVKLQMAKLSEFPNKGLIITVSPNHSMGFIESIARLVMKFMGLNLKKGVFVRTMDEAIARIHMEEQNAEVA